MADTPVQDRKAKLPRVRVGGRFMTAYDPALALRICERLADGETLTAICRPPEEPELDEDGNPKPWPYPARQTFQRWVVNHPELSQAYMAARELSAHSMEEEAVDMAREIARDPGTAQRVRAFDVAMNQLRWSASKRNPRVYSERGAVSFVVPIQINTSIDLGAGAVSGTAEHPDIYALEAKVVGEESVEGTAANRPKAPVAQPGLVDDEVKVRERKEPVAAKGPRKPPGRTKGAKSKFLRGLDDVKLIVGGKVLKEEAEE